MIKNLKEQQEYPRILFEILVFKENKGGSKFKLCLEDILNVISLRNHIRKCVVFIMGVRFYLKFVPC